MEKMKRLTALLCLLLALMPTLLHAQVVDVCAGDGTDSVTLSVDNYQYGNIQWQISEDTLTWTDIPGANDTVYRFKPEGNETRYYRAWMQYPNCPDESSAVTRVQFLPNANAGPDRILNENFVTTLFGNGVEDEGVRCMWQVIEGDSANLEDPTYCNSRFSGPDTMYRLTWTVANACGVSIDTVEIRYVHTVMYDAIVVVDTTDIILSDSAEMASGIYRIVFGNPVPVITDSTVLVGMVDDGFLRKVLYFEYYGDTCEMVTSQGYITDILKEGAINLEIPMSLAVSSQRGGSYHSFTRAELLQDPRFLSGNWGALLDGLVQSYQRNLIVNNWNIGDVTLGGHWDIQDLTPDFSDVKLIEDWYVHPYVVFGNGYVSFKVGFVGDAKVDFKLHASQFAAPFHVTKDISPLTFGLPGLANVKLGVSLDFAVMLSANLSDGIEKHYIYTKPIYYVAEGEVLVAGGVPIPINIDFDTTKAGDGKIVEIEPEHINTNVSLELSLAIGPKLSGILLFKTVELYLEFMPKIAFVFCYGANGFKSDSTELRLYEEIGLKVIGLWNPNMFWEQTLKSWKRPYRMAMGPNTNRNLVPPAAGAWISDPIQVQVFKQNGEPRGGNKVLFETYDGVLSSSPSGAGSASVSAYTDLNGIAQIYWKPNNAVAPTLKASVLDCEGNHIEGSPLFFYAENACANSTLSLDVVDGRLVPSGYSGDYGFLFLEYSSDNINWTNPASNLYPLVPGTTYFVKDNNGCKAATTYTVQESTPDCNLGISTQQNGMTVLMVVSNGTAPYHYYVDGVDQTLGGYSNWRWQHTFTQEGDHSLAVSDANGCTMNTVVSVSDGITIPTVATSTTYNTVHNVYDQVMGAVTDNGGAPVLERGVQWSLSSDMSNATNVTSSFTGDGLGRFVCNISGVSAGTTYYARAYATNSKGPGYGEVITITVPGSAPTGNTNSCGVSSIRSNETGSNGTITAVRDHQNNSYAVVQIGNQCWLKENLRTTTSPSTSTRLIPTAGTGYTYTGKQARWYNNDSTTYAPQNYGLLYNWNATVDTFNTAFGETSVNTDGSNAVTASFSGHRRGICPEGWHLPTDAEWTSLTDFVSSQSQYICGGDTTYIAKALASAEGWNSSSSDCCPGNQSVTANNATGFGALPIGYYYNGYSNSGWGAYFWSSSQLASITHDAWARILSSGIAYMDLYSSYKGICLSVRCLRDADNGDTPTSDIQPCPGTPTVTDYDGNVYNTVQIGQQCWMKENLRTTHYADGVAIPVGGSATSYTDPYYYDYTSSGFALAQRGYYYNWPAVMRGAASSTANPSDVQGICPTGWHVPSDAEWTQLTDYVGGRSEYICGGNTANIAKALASELGWSSYSGACYPGDQSVTGNNATGFSAVPAGYCYGSSFDGADIHADFWSSSQYESGSNGAYYRYLYCGSTYVSWGTTDKFDGFSVRCLRD